MLPTAIPTRTISEVETLKSGKVEQVEQVDSLNQRIAADLTAAMKAKDAARLAALRMLKAAVTNKGMVEKGRELNDAEVLQVVASLVKQRRDSIEQFAQAGRTDLVDKETAEITVLEHYLPPAASADEIDAAVAG